MDKLHRATHTGKLHILGIDSDIECYVLDDGTRVLAGRWMIAALGMKRGGTDSHGERLQVFLEQERFKPFVNKDLLIASNAFKFRTTRGKIADGYKAEILVDICEAILDARKAGVLMKRQQHIADHCEILMRGFARVGIAALVDEATGYQEIRDKKALQKILDKYLLKEYASWAKRFPDEFYKEIFRLRNWVWNGVSVKRPGIIGRYTNDIVYERLAPGVLDELRQRNPVREDGTRAQRHHQWLTPGTGHPALDRHLFSVIALMRASANWGQFDRLLERSFPKLGHTLPLLFEE
jgi:hypothetical protein